MVVAGLGFLTVALLIALAAYLGALLAFLIVGLMFVGVGLILLALATRREARPAEPPAPPQSALGATLVGAFVDGMRAGQSVRRR